MWAAWGDHDDLLWNSQHFALCLTFLILNDQSRARSEDAMRTLHSALWKKQSDVLEPVITRTHLACMAGFTLGGLMTFGLGAFVSWASAGYNLYTSSEALPKAMSKAVNLAGHFPQLARLSHLE